MGWCWFFSLNVYGMIPIFFPLVLNHFSVEWKLFNKVCDFLFSEGNQHHPILLVSHLSFVPCWINILLNACVLILFDVDAWNKISIVFILCFGSWGAQTIHYFELIWLVESPFNARFNQHDSSIFIECLWPPIFMNNRLSLKQQTILCGRALILAWEKLNSL
jgi:hypothetical protein